MIKILVFGVSNIYGGIEACMKNIFDNVSKDKYIFEFVSFSNNGPIAYEEEFKKNNAKIIKIPNRKNSFFSYKKRIIDLFKKNSYDYIIFNIMSYEAFERIGWAIKYSNAQVVTYSHNAGFGKNARMHTRLLHWFGKKYLKNKRYIKVACGNDAGKWMYRNESFKIIDNGVSFDKYAFNEDKRKLYRKLYNIKEDEFVFGHTGRLEKQKNHKLLVDIFYKYQLVYPNSKLILVGEGTLKKEIQNQIENLGISNKVIMPGFLSKVNEIYSAFDVFVFPSLYEGLSISLVEAQINGLKCICSSTIDKTSDISGNVKFIDINEKDWTKEIGNNVERDFQIKNHINKDFFVENSIKKFEELFI